MTGITLLLLWIPRVTVGRWGYVRTRVRVWCACGSGGRRVRRVDHRRSFRAVGPGAGRGAGGLAAPGGPRRRAGRRSGAPARGPRRGAAGGTRPGLGGVAHRGGDAGGPGRDPRGRPCPAGHRPGRGRPRRLCPSPGRAPGHEGPARPRCHHVAARPRHSRRHRVRQRRRPPPDGRGARSAPRGDADPGRVAQDDAARSPEGRRRRRTEPLPGRVEDRRDPRPDRPRRRRRATRAARRRGFAVVLRGDRHPRPR